MISWTQLVSSLTHLPSLLGPHIFKYINIDHTYREDENISLPLKGVEHSGIPCDGVCDDSDDSQSVVFEVTGGGDT